MAKAPAKRRSGKATHAAPKNKRVRPRNRLALSWLLERRRRDGARARPVSPAAVAAFGGVFFVAIVGVTLWLGGFADDTLNLASRVSRTALVEAGFTLQHVEVRGAREAEAEEVAATLAVQPGTMIFDFDPQAAKERIEALAWVDHAVVLRLLPNRVVIMIDERRPLALWGSPNGVVLLDAEGETVEGVDPAAYDGLPRLEGALAPQAAADLIRALERRPALARRVASVERIGGRRWDMTLLSGLLVQLPEGDADAALNELVALDAAGDVLSLPLEVLDLRGGDVVMRARSLPEGRYGLVFERGA